VSGAPDTLARPAPGGAPVAALWMTGAIGSFSLMAVAGREMASHLDTFEIMTWRSLIGFALVVGVGVATGRLGQVRTGRARLHLARNVCHFTGQNLWFYSLTLIPLAQVFALEFTTPIWVALLAPLALGERMTPARALAGALGFAGVLVVARPGLTPIGIGHAAILLAALGFAANVLATKALSRTESVWTILFWMTAMQAAMGLACAGADLDMALPRADQLHWLIAVGVCGLTAHLCIASALAAAPATIVAPMDFLRLPLIAVVGMLVYGEKLELAVFAGAALIVAGNLVNVRAEGRR